LALDHSFEEYLMVCVEPDFYERTDVTYATYGKLLVLTLKVVGDVKVPLGGMLHSCCHKELSGSREIWAESAYNLWTLSVS
jgi:hypothetical protein